MWIDVGRVTAASHASSKHASSLPHHNLVILIVLSCRSPSRLCPSSVLFAKYYHTIQRFLSLSNITFFLRQDPSVATIVVLDWIQGSAVVNTLASDVRGLTRLFLITGMLALLVATTWVLLVCALTERVGFDVRAPVCHINAGISW